MAVRRVSRIQKEDELLQKAMRKKSRKVTSRNTLNILTVCVLPGAGVAAGGLVGVHGEGGCPHHAGGHAAGPGEEGQGRLGRPGEARGARVLSIYSVSGLFIHYLFVL